MRECALRVFFVPSLLAVVDDLVQILVLAGRKGRKVVRRRL